jgi:ankyrin repeat protein
MKSLKRIVGAGGRLSRQRQTPIVRAPYTVDDLIRIINMDIEESWREQRFTPNSVYDYGTNKEGAVQKIIELGATQQQIKDLIEICFIKEELEYFRFLIPHLENPISFFPSFFHLELTPIRLVIADIFINNITANGDDINAVIDFETGHTLLIFAAEAINKITQNCDFLKFLIDRGANINAQTNDIYGEETPLHIVVRSKHSKVVKFLIERGANLNIQDSDGDTPVMWACRNKNLDIMSLLIESGAIVNLTNNSGYSIRKDNFYKNYLEEKIKELNKNIENLTVALSGTLDKEGATMMAVHLYDPKGESDFSIRLREKKERNEMKKEDTKSKTKKGGKYRKQKSYRKKK